MNDLRLRDAWCVAGVAVTSILLLTFALYQQQVIFLVHRWNQLGDGDYAHGYLILLICVYLIFYNRQRLAVLTPCPEYRAILVIIFASIIWMIAALVDMEVLQVIGLLLLVLSILWAILGTQIAKILAFPILYISFAIPVWSLLTPFLQELTADVIFWLVRLIEVPAYRIENMIVLPAGKLSIEEACAGMRYLLAALILGALYAYLNYVTFFSRLIIVLVSAVTAVLANMLRVFVVVYLGYSTDMQHPLVHEHVNFGWYLFGGLVVILLVVEALWNRRCLHKIGGLQDSVEYKSIPCEKGKLQLVVFVLVVVILISVGPAIVFWKNNQSQPDSISVQIQLPLAAGEWSVMDGYEDDWIPQYQGAIPHRTVFHDKNNREIYLYLGIYSTQRQGEELIYYLNRISDDKVWHASYQREKQYNVGGQWVLEQLLEKDDGTQRLVWYWYRVAGQDTVNKYYAKALQVLGLFNGEQQASVVAIATKMDGEPEYAREALSQFAAEMGPSLIRVIDDTK